MIRSRSWLVADQTLSSNERGHDLNGVLSAGVAVNATDPVDKWPKWPIMVEKPFGFAAMTPAQDLSIGNRWPD